MVEVSGGEDSPPVIDGEMRGDVIKPICVANTTKQRYDLGKNQQKEVKLANYWGGTYIVGVEVPTEASR